MLGKIKDVDNLILEHIRYNDEIGVNCLGFYISNGSSAVKINQNHLLDYVICTHKDFDFYLDAKGRVI